jgi:hypothetical protein
MKYDEVWIRQSMQFEIKLLRDRVSAFESGEKYVQIPCFYSAEPGWTALRDYFGPGTDMFCYIYAFLTAASNGPEMLRKPVVSPARNSRD